mmetsp:Transcript_25446/g.59140  ORF Transcript_25446/g.59140 Transcript_25446/m.59140 type:complete len:236 (+) Transcript_25446:2466-3173(+)
MFINGRNESRHNNGECMVVSCGSKECLRTEEVDSVICGDGPVVVFSRSVNVVERLFLEKSSKAMLGGRFLNDLHDHQVLVDLGGVGSVHGSKLELVGCDLTMAGLERDSHLPALVLDLLHACQRGSSRRRRCHVVVAHFLATGSILSDQRTAGELKIRTLVVGIPGHEEDFLFQTNVGANSTGHIQSKLFQKTAAVLVESIVGAQQRSLLVESGTVVRHKDGRNEDGVASEENRG